MNAGRTNVLLSKCGGGNSAFESGASAAATSSSSATTTITTASGGTQVVSHYISSSPVATGSYQLPIGLVSVNHTQQQQHHHQQQQQQPHHLIQHHHQQPQQIHQVDSRIINQMHRRQSQDKAAILSPHAPFLTPSPSPSIPASPRLQPSPALSPFPQDVLLLSNIQEHDRRAATPGRRPSVQGQLSSSPNAGTIVFRPSPTQSPAAAQTTVIIGGQSSVNEINTTQIGSNNISLQNKKNGKRTNSSNHHHGAQHVNLVANSPKGAPKKTLSSMPSPIASPSPSPSPNAAALRPPTPQPHQHQYQQQQHHIQQQHSHIIQQYPTTTMLNANNQLVQIIQGPAIMSSQTQPQHHHHQQHVQQRQNLPHNQQQSHQSTASSASSKQNKMPQQILPKPSNVLVSSSSIYNQPLTTVQTSASSGNNKNKGPQQQQSVIATTHQTQQQHQSNQGAPIILPTGSLSHQQLMLNQMPMLVQQNTPQGVQLILRQPQQQPQLTTQGLVIHNNNRQQMQPQQTQQPQLLRILNTNGTPMQLTSNTPTFIVSSQANIIHQQQNMQTIKTASPITQIQTLSNQQPQLATTINGQFGLGRGVTQIQNLQLNGNLTHIQMPNGLNGQLFSQLPANFQQQLASYNPNINFNQLSSANFQQIAAAAAAAAASGAAFQSPPPAQTGDMVVTAGGQSIQFSQSNNNGGGQINVTASIPSSPIMTHGGHILPAVTPEPRQPTPLTLLPPHTVVIQDTKPSPASTPTPSIHVMDSPSANTVEHAALPPPPPPPVLPKTPKKPKKPRAKKTVAPKTIPPVPQQFPQTTYTTGPSSQMASSASGNSPTATSPGSNQTTTTSTGKLDLANVMKLCGIMEDDDEFMDTDEQLQPPTHHEHMPMVVEEHQVLSDHSLSSTTAAACPDIMVTIPYSHNTDVPYSFTIPATSSMPTNSTDAEPTNILGNTKIASPPTETISSQHNSNTGAIPKIDTSEINQQYTIKIDHSDASSGGGFPLTISIPKMTESTNTSSLAAPAAAMSTSMCVPSFVNSVLNSTVTPTLQSQINEIQNQLMGVGNLSDPIEHVTSSVVTPTVTSFSVQPSTNQTTTQSAPTTNLTVTTGKVTTPAVGAQVAKPVAAKPVRKRPPKKSTKKPAVNTIATVSVPSQIGNIQISQVDTSKGVVPGMHPKLIENQIQITPIIDTKSSVSTAPPTQQQQPPMQNNQINNQLPTNLPMNNQQTTSPLVQESSIQNPSIQQVQPTTHQIQITSQQPHPNLLPPPPPPPPQLAPANAVVPPLQPAHTIPQLTGSLSLSLVEDGRLILRHNPNQPQDAQSQMILQAILSGALCNVTLINEPIILDKPAAPAAQHQPQQSMAITASTPSLISSGIATNRNAANVATSTSTTSNQVRSSASSSTKVMTTTTTTTKNATFFQQPNNAPSHHVSDPNAHVFPQQQQQHSKVLQQPAQLQMQHQFQSPQALQHQVIQNHQTHSNQNAVQQQQQQIPSKLNARQQQNQAQLQHTQPQQPNQAKTGPNTQPTSSTVKDPAQTASKFIELPKIDPNTQQLFSLNTITNQITQLSPGLTTAALGPMERLLIVPAGINAQQLAQCLLQGQIHFNNIGQAAQAPVPSSQPQLHAIQQTQHQLQTHPQPAPGQPTNVASLPTKKVLPVVAENKARKAKPRPKKTEAVKPVRQVVVQPLAKTNQNDIKSPKPAETQPKTIAIPQPPSRPPSTSSFPSQTSSIPPIQFTNHNNQNGPQQQNVQIVRPSIQQHTAAPLVRPTANNNNQHHVTSAPSHSGPRMAMIHQRPATQVQLNQMQMQQMNSHHHLSNGTNMSPGSMSAVPPLVSVHPIPQQHPAGSQSHQSTQPRVQTIQLTPQKQQLLKNVQMQIQSLSARLQNKSLLSTLTIPPDFDLNNPIHNNPLPMLSNINAMSDPEIHQALQRLFIEQQKILATGKVIAPMTNAAQPSFANGPVNTQPSTATAKPAIQYGQPPTSNTLPVKPSAVVPSVAPKAKPKSRAKANKQADTSKTTIQMSVSPQITTPTLVNRQATIRMTAVPAPSVATDPSKNLASNNATIQHRNVPYAVQTTSASSQPTLLYNHQQQHTVQMVSPGPPTSALPRMTHPSSLTIVPTKGTLPNSSIRQQAPSHVTMTLQPVVPKGVVIQKLAPIQMGNQQPASSLQKQPLPIKMVNHVQLKSMPPQNQTFVRPAMNVTTRLSSSPPLLVQQQISQNTAPSSMPLEEQMQLESSQLQSMNTTQPPTIAQNQQPDQLMPQSVRATSQPTTSNDVNATPASSTVDPQPNPTPGVDLQPPASPKLKVPRHCLFERQFDVDQDSCRNPDYQSPFQSKEDAVKRLIRYHALYLEDERPNAVDEEYFQRTADDFQGQFKSIVNKFQVLLMKESTLDVKTSELMMLDQMFASDVQEEIQHMQDYINKPQATEQKVDASQIALANDDIKPDMQLHQHQPQLVCADPNIKTEVIKNEIKAEPLTHNHSAYHQSKADTLPTVLQMLEDSLSSDSQTILNNNCSEAMSAQQDGVKLESFDIESELTQSVIMKKNKHLPALDTLNIASNSPIDGAEFSMDYLCSSSNSSTLKPKHNMDDVDDDNASSSTSSKEPYDEWMSIQKELSMMADKRIDLNATSAPAHVSPDLSGAMRSSAPLSIHRPVPSGRDMFYPLADTPKHDLEHFINASKSSGGHDSPLSELFNTDSSNFDRRKNATNRIDSLLESRLDDLFTGTASSPSLADLHKHHDSGLVVHKDAPRTPNDDDDWIHNTPLQVGGSQDSSKLHWSASEILSSTSVSPSSPTQFSTNAVSAQVKRSSCMDPQQQSTVFHEDHSNHRWMMDCAAQPTYDYGVSHNSSELMSGGLKRSWTDTLDGINTSKKMCFNNIGATVDRELLSSPSHTINHHGLHHNNHNSMDQNSLMNHLNNGAANHMSDGSSFADVLQSLGAGQMCGANANSNTSLMSNFDDDINRHVQNAIDSILNLQSNENESMHFPLDPAMASFLAENSPLSGSGSGVANHQLNHPHTNHHPPQTSHVQPNHQQHQSMNHQHAGAHMQHSAPRIGHLGAVSKRRMHNRMDDISDCLISGGGSDSNGASGMMMVDSPGSADLVGGAVGVGGNGGIAGGGNGAGEFNMTSGIDEAIKSIITS